ncbi:pilus assembly protein [Kineosporia sp. J2-2]|uniref:Pilus assembly protein n=1 Tax=Kineosporia corallincola TaxID=2835133 RepID=A0ABS5TTT2_9ACTN|nr:TadE family protein [Kineosporia corallincola]MBT0774210.1 pilus assembly protein [Kineosporia corallincola]
MSAHTRSAPARDSARADHGASTVELLVWFPALLLIVAIVLQVFQAVWAHETAQAAARYGAYQARSYQGSDADGRRAAGTYLDQVAGTLVQDPVVTVTRTDSTVTVTITATARQMPLPVLHLRAFTVSASGPIEQFTAAR